MKDGNLTVGANISIGGTNIPAGSYVSNGLVYNPSGIVIPGVTPASFQNVLGVDANGNPLPSGAASVDCGDGFTKVSGVCFPTNTGLSNNTIYGILSNLFFWMMGLFVTLAVMAFVISGVQYFMASGNEDLAETAKHNATNAVIGIIVGLSGYIIVKAIAAALSGTSVLF
jgi:hypothetical protein